MFELVMSGGWIMVPIVLCTSVAMAIIAERFWFLRKQNVSPPQLLAQVQQWLQRKELDANRVSQLRNGSPLGQVLAAGLINQQHDREIIKQAIEDAGRHVVPELERHLNTLGTIAAISPFLGLLGTVFGMIKMFAGLGSQGLGDPSLVANGISQALIATAAGLVAAIPSLMFYRYFRGRVDELLLDMEKEALKLVQILQGRREKD